MNLQELVGYLTDLAQEQPRLRTWDVVSVDCLFREMYLAGAGSEGKYVGLGQQLGPESPRADSTY